MTSIRKELEEFGLVPRKGLGQHFLVDKNILNKVIQAAGVGKEDVVLEIGPGMGQMTALLASHARRVVAIEIDPKLTGILREKMRAHPNVEVIREDVLKSNLKRFSAQEGEKMKVVANLPYQISTPLLFRLIEIREIFSTLTLMLQKEVAERMVAPPGVKDYGPLSIFVQLVSNPSIRFFIPPTAFFPPPKVESALVHITWKERPSAEVKDEEWFGRVVRGCFGYRRKMLINGLKHSGLSVPVEVERKMEGMGIDPRRRPETLTIKEFACLAEVLKP